MPYKKMLKKLFGEKLPSEGIFSAINEKEFLVNLKKKNKEFEKNFLEKLNLIPQNRQFLSRNSEKKNLSFENWLEISEDFNCENFFIKKKQNLKQKKKKTLLLLEEILSEINDEICSEINTLCIKASNSAPLKFFLKTENETHQKIDIILEDGVQEQVILNLKNLSHSTFLINIHIHAKKFSKLSLTINHKASGWGFLKVSTHQEENSEINIHNYIEGKGSYYTYYEVFLREKKSKINLYGTVKSEANATIGNKIKIYHQSRDTFSSQMYRHVLRDESEVMFDGAIDVAKEAKRTESYQANDSIILSADAILHTRPILSIFEDEVKCSHGATIGNLDKSQINYLRSRGINHLEAEKILIDAFIEKVFSKNNIDTLLFLDRQY